MFKFQEYFYSAVEERLSECETEEERKESLRKIEESIPEICDEMAEVMLDTIKEDVSSGLLEEMRQDRRGFEQRLRKLWGEPLDLLEMFIAAALEAGSEFNEKHRKDSVAANDAVFHALTQLHARACQISSAILVLLNSGFADDADARWRSLHEIAVVSCFLCDRGQELAERYLYHEVIQQYKLACEHQKHYRRLNDEPISQEEFDNLETLRNKLVCQFGDQFKGPYGWAANELGVGRPNFTDIEKETGLGHWRPHYKMASDNVHANSHGAVFRLGLYLAEEKVLLAGPSDARLVDPGHSTAISLNQVTTALLSTRTSLDSIVVSAMLTKLEREIGESFLQAHHQFEANTLEGRRPDS